MHQHLLISRCPCHNSCFLTVHSCFVWKHFVRCEHRQTYRGPSDRKSCNFIIQPESQGKSFCVYRSDCCTQHNSSTARIPIGIEEKPECGKIGVDERIKAQICQMVGERGNTEAKQRTKRGAVVCGELSSLFVSPAALLQLSTNGIPMGQERFQRACTAQAA